MQISLSVFCADSPLSILLSLWRHTQRPLSESRKNPQKWDFYFLVFFSLQLMSSDGTRIFLFRLHPLANQMDQKWYHANRRAISLANLIIKTKTKPLLKFCDSEDLSLPLWVQKNLRVWCASRQVGWWPLFFSSAAQCTATSLNKNSANTQHLYFFCPCVVLWKNGDDGSSETLPPRDEPDSGCRIRTGWLRTGPVRPDPERAWQDPKRHSRPDIQGDASRLRQADEWP